MRAALVALAFVILPLQAARAQSPPEITWRASAGYDTFAFRDVASTRPPVDASPVRWRGSGPILTVDYERARPLRLHRFGVTASSSGTFAYETGVGTVARPSEDAASFLEAQYDYRRYLARALLFRGLHAGIGVRGIGERSVLRHHYGGDVALTETDLTGSIAVVAALRLRRSGRFGAEGEWGNAMTLGRGRQHHAADVVADVAGWGGGWMTGLAARADVRVAPHAAVVFSYSKRGAGLAFEHRAHTAERHRVMVGVTYAR